MVNRLYLDGCSFTYGLNLDKKYTLETLFTEHGKWCVNNQSRNGKSNLAIAMDAYQNCQDHDTFVLGFTFSGRFHIKYQQHNIDFQPIKYMLPLVPDYNVDQLELVYDKFHKYFYSLYQSPFCDDLSDFLIDAVCGYLISQGKKSLLFRGSGATHKHLCYILLFGQNKDCRADTSTKKAHSICII